MIEYPKTETLYNRNPNDMKHVILGDYRREEFRIVSRWLVTEKVDGTNIRVGYNTVTGEVRFGGRTDNAQTPTFLLDHLQRTFTSELLSTTFGPGVEGDLGGELAGDGEPDVVLFGEGYGPKIQKGGGRYRDDVSFALFDVRVGRWWLEWQNVEDVALKLGIETVPVLGRDVSLGSAVAMVDRKSVIAREHGDPEYVQEGVVARTDPWLFDRRGKRVMWKLKARDLRAG